MDQRPVSLSHSLFNPVCTFTTFISNFFPGWRIVRLLHCELLIKHSSALTTHGLIQSDKTMCIPLIHITVSQGSHLCDKKGLITHCSFLLTSTLIDGTPKVLFYGFLIRALESDYSRLEKNQIACRHLLLRTIMTVSASRYEVGREHITDMLTVRETGW